MDNIPFGLVSDFGPVIFANIPSQLGCFLLHQLRLFGCRVTFLLDAVPDDISSSGHDDRENNLFYMSSEEAGSAICSLGLCSFVFAALLGSFARF